MAVFYQPDLKVLLVFATVSHYTVNTYCCSSCSRTFYPFLPPDGTLAFPEQPGHQCAGVKVRPLFYFFLFSDLSTENLRFLSSRQALADLAHFRTMVAEAHGLTNAQWVAFGGSYPGSLAAWFRLKYPHLVHAAVATSAPVHATVNFPGTKTVSFYTNLYHSVH